MIFYPDYRFDTVADITDDFLRERDIRALMLDVDNTLATHDNPEPAPNIARWVERRKAEGMPMVIVSNNRLERVEVFAKIFELPFVSAAGKPLSKGLSKAYDILGTPRSQIAFVGDQVLTDILGANLFKITSIMVRPVGEETLGTIRFKRRIEKILLRRYDRRTKT